MRLKLSCRASLSIEGREKPSIAKNFLALADECPRNSLIGLAWLTHKDSWRELACKSQLQFFSRGLRPGASDQHHLAAHQASLHQFFLGYFLHRCYRRTSPQYVSLGQNLAHEVAMILPWVLQYSLCPAGTSPSAFKQAVRSIRSTKSQAATFGPFSWPLLPMDFVGPNSRDLIHWSWRLEPGEVALGTSNRPRGSQWIGHIVGQDEKPVCSAWASLDWCLGIANLGADLPSSRSLAFHLCLRRNRANFRSRYQRHLLFLSIFAKTCQT